MLTRGRFICHVHCLVQDGAVRSSPCRSHHEHFGRNFYHVFVPAYSASQPLVLFRVVVFVLLRRHMLIPSLVDVPLLPDSSWLRNLGICDHFKRSAFVHFVRMWRLYVAISTRLIQLQYLSINVLIDVNLFRMAPPTRTTPNPDPPPPPPSPEAWQAVMAATNANTQLIIHTLWSVWSGVCLLHLWCHDDIHRKILQTLFRYPNLLHRRPIPQLVPIYLANTSPF